MQKLSELKYPNLSYLFTDNIREHRYLPSSTRLNIQQFHIKNLTLLCTKKRGGPYRGTKIWGDNQSPPPPDPHSCQTLLKTWSRIKDWAITPDCHNLQCNLMSIGEKHGANSLPKPCSSSWQSCMEMLYTTNCPTLCPVLSDLNVDWRTCCP